MKSGESFLPRLSSRASKGLIGFAVLAFMLGTVAGCKKETKPQARQPTEVAVVKVALRDTPVDMEFVGQTQSSHQVEIRARVNGFLDKRAYAEGSRVKMGQVMFTMDPKPFRAQLEAAQGALAQQQARLTTARENLARVKPLVEQNALSRKDLDDATGLEQGASAAVESAKAEVEQARLNLGYTTIRSPVNGLSSYARVQEGAYINPQNSLLTYVSQTNPIWVNFSLSENDVLKYREDTKRGLVRLQKGEAFVVEVVLADGTLFPHKGRLTFADAEYNQQTGTFLVRGSLSNPQAALKPGQFVRVRLQGAMRPNAILLPQSAVLQGAQGHFVWVVDKDGNAQVRNIDVGPWHGTDQWFIDKGLAAGDVVIVNGLTRLASGAPVKAVQASTKQAEAKPSQGKQNGGAAPGAKPEAAQKSSRPVREASR